MIFGIMNYFKNRGVIKPSWWSDYLLAMNFDGENGSRSFIDYNPYKRKFAGASGFVETAQIHFMQWASGQIEFALGDTTQKTRAQYSALTAYHKGSSVWVLFGDREPA